MLSLFLLMTWKVNVSKDLHAAGCVTFSCLNVSVFGLTEDAGEQVSRKMIGTGSIFKSEVVFIFE